MGKRRWGRRLAGLVVLMVLLELALQAAGPLVQRAMLRRDPDPSPDAPLTILCVGDSNTYGLHMPRVFAYPAQLQGLLEQRFHQPVTVANRGVPGQNTAQVLAALPDDLAATHADLVLVLCGINDAWNTGAEERGFRG
ncbi:MAG TPA: GDSL-type esterase/lipase family protein, partial [Planctomycetota bacterium]|nr:GDSL-type esterase/lipase family protein [Planctomycetota bacterium]